MWAFSGKFHVSKNAPGPKIGPRNPRKWPFSGPGRPESAPLGPRPPPGPAPGPPGPESLYRPLFNSGVCTYTPRLPHARRASFFGYFLGGPGFLCAFPREPAETPPEPRIRAPRGRPRGPPGPPPGPPPPGPPEGPKTAPRTLILDIFSPQTPNFGPRTPRFQGPRPVFGPRAPECAGNASRAMPQRQKYVTLVEILHTFACKTVDLKRVLELRSHLSAAPGTETWRGLT